MTNSKNINQISDNVYGTVIGNIDGNVFFNSNTNETEIPKSLTSNLYSSEIFVGRKEIIIKLREIITLDNNVIVINGIGGIGKTTLVKHYIKAFQNEYKHIAWVTEQNSIFDTYGEVLISLNIETIGKTEDDIFLTFITKLREISIKSTNLLIIDNANNSHIKKYKKLPIGENCHIILISRERLIKEFPNLELDVLSKEDAFDLFRKYCYRTLENEEVNSLNEGVGYHTLAVEILSKTANEISGMTFDKLNNAIPNDMRTNIQVNYSDNTIENISTFLNTIFDLSNLEYEEKFILKQFTAMPSFSIEFNQIIKVLKDVNLKLDISIILNKLLDKGWLQREKDIINNNDNYRLHTLIKQVLLNEFTISESDIEFLIKNVSELLSFDQYKDNPIEKFQWVAFGNSILEVFSCTDSYSVTFLKSQLAQIYRIQGEYEKARELFTIVLESTEINSGKNHPNISHCKTDLGLIYKDLGENIKARDLLLDAHDIAIKYFDQNSREVTTARGNLGYIYSGLGEYDKAKDFLEKTLQSEIKYFGEESQKVSSVRTNLAIVYNALGNLDSAKELLEKALQCDLNFFTENHPNIAMRQSNLAIVYIEMKEYKKAKVLLEKALNSDIKNFGENHPAVFARQGNLALVYEKLNENEKAKNLLEKALQTGLNFFDSEHSKITNCQSNLIDIYLKTGEEDKARNLIEKLEEKIEMNKKVGNSNDVSYLEKLSNIYSEFRNYNKSINLLKLALEISLRLYNDHHLTVIRIQSNLGYLYMISEDFINAKEIFIKVLNTFLKNYDTEHPNIAIIQSNLGNVYMDLNENEKALDLLEKALELNLKIYGLDNVNVAGNQHNLASLLVKLGQKERAIILWKSAYKTFLSEYGENNSNTILTKSWLESLHIYDL